MFPNIRAELARKNVEYKAVAEELGITPISFTNKMSGKTDWKKVEIDFLLNFTNTTYEYLFFKDQSTVD